MFRERELGVILLPCQHAASKHHNHMCINELNYELNSAFCVCYSLWTVNVVKLNVVLNHWCHRALWDSLYKFAGSLIGRDSLKIPILTSTKILYVTTVNSGV